MLKNELLIETIGEPDVAVLGEFEQGVLLEMLFDDICKLHTNK